MDQEKDINSSEIVETEKQEISDHPNTGNINSEQTDELAKLIANSGVQEFILENKQHKCRHFKKQYKVLYVLQSEEHVSAFLQQKELVKYVMQEIDGEQWVKSKITTYDQFHSGNHEHTFDFVVFVFPLPTSLEDILAQQDMYIYFSNVPVCSFLVSYEEDLTSQSLGQILGFFQSNFKNRLVTTDPYFTEVKSIYQCLKKSSQAYDKKYENDLIIAFDKFDKDGSGSIDKQELADLSKELGSELSEEQLQNALKDLDLNSDGVIDIDEFARWYFSGMKPYSGLKRSLLQFGKSSQGILEALAFKKVSQAIHENLELTTHDFSFTLNDPKEAHTVDAQYHIIGPLYVKLLAESEAYRAQNAKDFVVKPRQTLVYGKVTVSLEPGNLEKNKKFLAPIEQILNDYFKLEDMGCIKFELTDSQLTITNLGCIPERYLPIIPASFAESLKDVEQYIHSHVTLGYDTEELLNEDKPLIEHLLKGFKFQTKISFLKSLKNALIKYFDGQKFGKFYSQFIKIWGPAMMFGSEINYKINFNDIEELKNHPYASQLLVSLHTMFTQLGAKERDYYLNYKEHIDTSILTEENQKFIKDKYKYQSRQNAMAEEVVLWENVLGMIDGFTQKTAIEGHFLFENGGVLDFKIQGKGFGKWLAHLLNIQVLEQMQDNIKRLKYYLEQK